MKKSKCCVEVYSRITGYFQVLKGWNEGKAQEFKDRKKYKLESDEEMTARIKAKSDREDMYPIG